jgi:hypothetical protein
MTPSSARLPLSSWLFLSLAVAWAAGCGNTEAGSTARTEPEEGAGESPQPEEQPEPAPAEPPTVQPAPAEPDRLDPPPRIESYRVQKVAGGGSIRGNIRFEGTPPPAKQMAVAKDPEVCGRNPRVIGAVQIGDGGALRGAVAYLERVDAGKGWPARPRELIQQGCEFRPTSLVMRRDETLAIHNRDPVFHNIHAYELAGTARLTMFNDGQPAGSNLERPLRMRRAHTAKLECDAHDFMHQWFLVLDHPYFAETDEGGTFEIGEVPPGSYFLRAWHPTLGELRAPIEVTAGGAASSVFTFRRP